jgi:aminoglycoside phosphotransferase (APT) family kinase protein
LSGWSGLNSKSKSNSGTDMCAFSVNEKGVALIVRAPGGYIVAKGTIQVYAASKNETYISVRQ